MFLRSIIPAVTFIWIAVTWVHAISATENSNRLTSVPELHGLRPGLANQMARLAEVELRTGVYYIAPDNWKPSMKSDRVYMQTPQGNSRVATGATVACWVFAKASRDKSVVATPDVSRLSLSDTQARLTSAGLEQLVSGVGSETSGDTENLIVLEQYPRAGQSVFVGTSVYLRLERKQAAPSQPSEPIIVQSTPVVAIAPVPLNAAVSPHKDLLQWITSPIGMAGLVGLLLTGTVVIFMYRGRFADVAQVSRGEIDK